MRYAGLAHYIPQSNNFVVFSTYFQIAGQQGLAASPWVRHSPADCMPCPLPALLIPPALPSLGDSGLLHLPG